MPNSLPIGAADYYELFPGVMHRAGDVWIDLPTLGCLPLRKVPGIVVTPTCDLENAKVESFTYLPIVSIRQAFTLRGFLPEVVRSINGLLQHLNIEPLDLDPTLKFVPFTLAQIAKVDGVVSQNTVPKHSATRERIKSALQILERAYGLEATPALGTELLSLFGESRFHEMTSKIVTNSHRSDVHFLPGDGQRPEWTAIAEPSLALFRYPISLPLELLDSAQDLGRADWAAEVTRLSQCVGCANYFSERPMKRLTVKPRFMADLITRYVSMYVRLGAPDFSDETIHTYVSLVKSS